MFKVFNDQVSRASGPTMIHANSIVDHYVVHQSFDRHDDWMERSAPL